MKFKYFFLFLFLTGSTTLMAQQEIQITGMTFKPRLVDDRIEILLEANTTGWLAVGFNHKNEIVGADLLQFRIEKDGTIYAEDQYVTSAGEHPSDVSLGGKNNIEILSGTQTANHTSILFSIPFNSGDQFDFPHQLGRDFWLILAYSVDRDFQHHSILRKHFLYRWE